MASTRHNTHLKQYLKAHKCASNTEYGTEKPSPKQSGSSSSSSPSNQRTNSSQAASISPKTSAGTGARPKTYIKKTTKLPQPRHKPTLTTLPEELVLRILSLLDTSDLLVCARVCQRWRHLANDNVLWAKLYEKHIGKAKKNQKPQPTPKTGASSPAFWKRECIRSCCENRNTKVLSLLKKVDNYTGLPAQTDKALQRLGVRWHLGFVDKESEEHFFPHRDVFFHRMSTCVRWYNMEMPSVGRIKKLKIYAACPVFFDKKGQALGNSACQMSLLHEYDFDWSRVSAKLEVVASDDSIILRILPPLLIATWKDGGDLAFITGNFHSYNIVHRCLAGTRTRAEGGTHRANANLFGFNITIDLRNQRSSVWIEQFRNIYFDKHEMATGSAKLVLISPDENFRHSPIPKRLDLPWKTDLFKNIAKDLCILDLILLNEQNDPAWCISCPVKVSQPSNTAVTYDYDGDQYRVHYEDSVGKVLMELVWEEEIGQYMITCLEVTLSLGSLGVL